MLGSGEDLMKRRLLERSDQRPIEVVDAPADVRGRIEPLTRALRARSRDEELARRGLTNWVPGFLGGTSLWGRYCANTVKAVSR